MNVFMDQTSNVLNALINPKNLLKTQALPKK